jgi:hypothetical protein
MTQVYVVVPIANVFEGLKKKKHWKTTKVNKWRCRNKKTNKKMIERFKNHALWPPKNSNVNKTCPLTHVECNNHSWPTILPTNSCVSFLTKPLSMRMWDLLAHFPPSTLGGHNTLTDWNIIGFIIWNSKWDTLQTQQLWSIDHQFNFTTKTKQWS